MSESSRYEPYSIEVDPADTDYEEWTLATVRPYDSGGGWEVANDDHTMCGVPALTEDRYGRALREPLEPKVGDTLRVYGRFGSQIQGQVLNGQVIWYRWPDQREAYRRRWVEDNDAKESREFILTRDELDRRYAELSLPFKKRLDRFRAEDPDFRRKSESYESFTLQQADLLIRHFGDAEKVRAWNQLEADRKYDEQHEQAPPGWSDQHSGNTHACAIGIAIAVLEGKEV